MNCSRILCTCITKDGYMVVLLVVVSLGLRTVPTNGAYVDHARSILNKGTALNGDIDVCEILQAEVDEGFELILA